ncbi:hypothetical protein HYDPIDRAFT_25358 [Hydnomerulius pinastri MD-312]|nr:hypothetical protein HYDPIDRAFT_25358 [Hydnomerulius pinastri MD-312]
MLTNFKNKYLNPLVQLRTPTEEEQDPFIKASQSEVPETGSHPGTNVASGTSNAERHWAIVMAETICVTGCACVFCRRRPAPDVETGRARDTTRTRPRRHRHTMAPTSTIMEILYPPSYLGTPPALPDPPAYFPDNPPPPMHEEYEQRTPLIFSRTAPRTEQPYSSPLPADAPAPGAPLIGPPTSGSSWGRTPSYVPPSHGHRPSPLCGLGIDIPDETEALPAYSQFDNSHPRFPAASDILGPYPHISLLSPFVR